MKYYKFLLVVAVILFCNGISAQNAMYKWRTHLAYNNTNQIAMAKDKVYAISNGALFSVTKNDKHIETYSKANGLNDNNVVCIAHSQKHGKLLVAYENGNIDFIADNGQIVNFPYVYRANINAGKELNNVLFDGDFAYLSYPFGIIKWSMHKMEVADTYFIGENGAFVDVKSLSLSDGYFYAVAANKIYKAYSGSNLLNFANWNLMTDVPEPAIPNIKAISYDSKLYLLKNNGNVYVLSNDFWENFPAYSGVTGIYANDNALFVIYNNVVSCSKSPQSIPFGSSVAMAVYDGSTSKIWAAAGNSGVVLSSLTATEDSFKPNGPAINECRKIKYSQERLYFVPSGVWITDIPGESGNVMIFENNEWKNIYQHEIESALGGTCIALVDIEIDRYDKTHFWAASFKSGIYEFRKDKPFFLHNSTTSNNKIEASSGNHYVDNLLLDSYSRLWFTNRAKIKCLEPDPDGPGHMTGDVINFTHLDANNILVPSHLAALSPNENIKLVTERTHMGGNPATFFFFDDNGTPDYDKDDRTKGRTGFYDQEGKSFSTIYIRGVAMDKKNNAVWAGTDVGPIILPNPQNFFNDNYTISRIKIPRNDGTGLADYLLDGQYVLCIKIDGENRKWIGTENSGVYLVSDDGVETIHHFTSENSPLLSNVVYDVGIHEKTGEVFFATARGIVSFQSDAIPPSPDKPFDNLHAYPNPVRPGYLANGGLITITGLGSENSDLTIVKIVDTAGNLVYEDARKGGMVTWDGRRKSGDIVSTGVYIAICTTKDGKHHATTKILIVN